MSKKQDFDQLKESYKETREMKTESPVKVPAMVLLTFRENRKFDLHIGREMKTFRGRQTLPVPAGWVKHKDFKNVAKFFVIGKKLGGK